LTLLLREGVFPIEGSQFRRKIVKTAISIGVPVIQNAGHFPFLEQPQEFALAVGQFLGEPD
jgi:pimeloyl-ACP methyl ester carboxylesterase